MLPDWADALERGQVALAGRGQIDNRFRPAAVECQNVSGRERPELFAQGLKALKHRLDPKAVLNPGILVDP